MSPTTIPILPSNDLDDTAEFYASIGFEERARWAGDYLILFHPIGIEIHFWLSAEPIAPSEAAGCYVRFAGPDQVRELYEPWSHKQLDLHPLVETDYGLLEFALRDPHNNQIRFGG